MRTKLLAIGFIAALTIGAALPSAALAHQGGDNRSGDSGCSEFGQIISSDAQTRPGIGEPVSLRAKIRVWENQVAFDHNVRC